MTSQKIRLLLICTGNTCRSQMAHALATDWSQKNSQTMEFASRGIKASNGSQTTQEARRVLAEYGVQWRGSSLQLLTEDLLWADYVWVMTQQHLNFVAQLATSLNPNQRPAVELLDGEQEITDPLGLGLKAYQALYIQLTELLPIRLAALAGPSAA